MKVFKWINLMPLPTKDDMEPKDITRIFIIESRNNPISRGEYLNPRIGDLPLELLQDVYKCAYYNRQKDPAINAELAAVLQSYCNYVIENWAALEKGSYNEISTRPEVNFKEFLFEDIVRDNLPELSQEEKILISLETMDLPKSLA